MAKLNYAVVAVDMAVPRTFPTPVDKVGVGVKYSGVTVMQLPGGTVASMFFGPNGDAVPIVAVLQSHAFENDQGCPFFCDEGLFITNAGGAGILLLLVAFQQGA